MKNDIDQLISAYIDGELASDEAVELEKNMIENPNIRDAYTSMLNGDALLVSACSLLNEQVSLDTSYEAINASREATLGKTPVMYTFSGIAASILITAGVLTFHLFNLTERPPSTQDLIAKSLSGDAWLDEHKRYNHVLSFKAKSGHYCKFLTRSNSELSEEIILCHEKGTWVTRALERKVSPKAEALYLPAGGSSRGMVHTFISKNMGEGLLSNDEELSLNENLSTRLHLRGNSSD